jgi:hypothetical protein
MCPIGVACYPRRICTLHHRLTSLYPGQRSGNHPCHSLANITVHSPLFMLILGINHQYSSTFDFHISLEVNTQRP